MVNTRVWNLIQAAFRNIYPICDPVIVGFENRTGLTGAAVGVLLAALTFEPDPVSSARLVVRVPFTAVARYSQSLSILAENGFLAEAQPGEFRLTVRGLSEVQALVNRMRAVMAESDPLPLTRSERLAELLGGLVNACLSAPSPPGHWSINLAHKIMPAPTPPLPYAEQAFSCLNAYRDDAHLAAWQPGGLSAAALESLTLLWRQEAGSLTEIVQRLSRRGHPSNIYNDALEELRGRGFVEAGKSAYRLTDSGAQYRENVESETDRYFFKPWDRLMGYEKSELADLLEELRAGLSSIHGG